MAESICGTCGSRDPETQICEWCGEELPWPAKDGFCTDGVGRVRPCTDPFHSGSVQHEGED